MSSLLTLLKRLFTITRVAANSAAGCASPNVYRRTAPQSLRFFCARVMAGCAWESFGAAGFLYSGLAHLRTARHPSCASDAASSKTSVQELHHD